MTRLERDVRPLSRVVTAIKGPRLRVIDEAQRDIDAALGKWTRRLVPVACAAYIAWALLGGGR